MIIIVVAAMIWMLSQIRNCLSDYLFQISQIYSINVHILRYYEKSIINYQSNH